MRRPLILAVTAALLAGCGGNRYYAKDYAQPPGPPQEAGGLEEVQARGSYSNAGAMADEQPAAWQSASKSKAAWDQNQAAQVPSTPKGEPAVKGRPAEPLVVYQGFLRVRVKRLLDAVDALTRTVQQAGGHVESVSGAVVVVRVPAKDFEKTMDALGAVGEVLDRRVKALDVTDQFTDLGARLAVAKEARARLLKLLEGEANPEERLRILQEIKRLSETVESMESTLATLKNLVDFFTVTLELVPVVAEAVAETHRSPFPWVRSLTPHRVTVDDGKTEVDLVLPKGFVRFDRDDTWRAQASDTTELRAGRVDNEPRGDETFWMAAVAHEMEGRDEEKVGAGTGRVAWSAWRNKDVQPRYYVVGVYALGDRLYVLEAFFPTEAAFKAHRDDVEKALQSFKAR